MYEKHFGLNSRPFGSKAEGAGVFVGPQQAKIMNSLKKGLGARDAVVSVTGPVGVGKTTIVSRALESISPGRMVAWVGRMQLAPDEVLELLLTGFGIQRQAKGTIQRFAAFRRLLHERAAIGAQVAIVVEDVHRIGKDALIELESLTAADTGDATSANIILMGQPGLHDLLSTPDLARMKQRNRLRQAIDAFSEAEVQGYLKHSIREAGGDYDSIFDPGVAKVIYGCSEGIPRMINTLCESALTTAMEENSARVTVALMNQVATDAFGYARETTGQLPVLSAVEAATPEPADTVDAPCEGEDNIDREAPPKAEITDEAMAIEAKPEIGHDIIIESGSYPIPSLTKAATGSPEIEDVAVEIVDSGNDDDIDTVPELINDTQPELPELEVPPNDEFDDLPVLRPGVAASREDEHPAAEDDEDIESTQTVVQPVGLKIDEAVGDADVEGAVPATEAVATDESNEENFDLDAALSPDIDETNVMPGITPHFDALGSNNEDSASTSNVRTSASGVATEPAAAAMIEPVSEPEAAIEPAPAAPTAEIQADVASADDESQVDLPTLSDSMRVEMKKEVSRANAVEPDDAAAKSDLPAVDASGNEPAMRDLSSANTGENRQSDIDALEAALAAAKNGGLASQKTMPAVPNVNGMAPGVAAEDAPLEIPEITLDNVIASQQKQNADLDRFREELGNANSLEDMSDGMAETLFGCESFDQIAADVVANPPAGHESTDADSNPSPVMLSEDEMPNAANDIGDDQHEERRSAVRPFTQEIKAQPTRQYDVSDGDVPMNESVALRIDILNKMKSNAARVSENVELGRDDPEANIPKPKGPQPEPIERQINTSMTQTLEALNINKMRPEPEAEEKPEKKSGGLFSRFKKSS